MKPNLVIVHPPEIGFDSAIESFCEKLCETHYVYLIRPATGFRDDSPAGVRFLNHPLDSLPGFAEVETAIAIGGEEVLSSLKQAYPASVHAIWDPERHGEFPLASLPALCPTIVQGDFGKSGDSRLAEAM